MSGSQALFLGTHREPLFRGVLALFILCVCGCGRSQPPAEPAAPEETAQPAPAEPAAADEAKSPADQSAAAPQQPSAAPSGRGAELFAQHCAACHGEKGNGQGLAAVFLYPKPRDFRAGRFRLISTVNGVPTLEDLERVLVRGLPGSSMVSWAHLPAEDRRALAEQVLQFRRDGAADLERQLAAEEGEELSAAEVAERVASLTTPGEVLQAPDLGTATPEVLAAGKELYVSKGCAACHGATGKGDGQQQMVDSEGFATRPRDLTLGIYKGEHDPQSIYRRLRLGLPGSPMPASTLPDTELAAMVHFVLSLSDEATRESHVLRRKELVAAKLPRAPQLADDEAWASVPSVPVSLTPLWWRNDAAPEITVQAARDDRELVLRLTWSDATQDDRAIRQDQFEDLVAVELYQGSAEPFLGMGAKGAVIDLWQWRGGAKATGADESLLDDYPFDTDVYRELAQGKPLPDFVTAHAAENPLALHERDAGALQAAGFGSTTFLPKASQLVVGEGKWHDGRWTVVLRRPLDVPSDAGLPLAAGGKYSIAFAVWDGSARDRGPQKLISMWNDLRVE